MFFFAEFSSASLRPDFRREAGVCKTQNPVIHYPEYFKKSRERKTTGKVRVRFSVESEKKSRRKDDAERAFAPLFCCSADLPGWSGVRCRSACRDCDFTHGGCFRTADGGKNGRMDRAVRQRADRHAENDRDSDHLFFLWSAERRVSRSGNSAGWGPVFWGGTFSPRCLRRYSE